MIEVKNISKSFGEIYAVKNLSFEIKEGEIFGIIFDASRNELAENLEGYIRQKIKFIFTLFLFLFLFVCWIWNWNFNFNNI